MNNILNASFTGKIDVNPHFMLASHLNAILGTFWLFCLAQSWQWIDLSERSKVILYRSTLIAAWANWLITLIKSVLKVQGIDWVGEAYNDLIFMILTLTVVLPTFCSSILWILGVRRGLNNPTTAPPLETGAK